ncbi:leucine-rich repeat protein [Butyrivibrio sp. XPD2002]|uniref:leucine-rich repeat protein n=1 Tax=Butyrivibrio sp. XPD2002 TaxID=1280665 RepID=UPI003FA41976
MVPAEVVLRDGNTYKVTKVGDRAFADIAGKEKIKEIKIGDNTTEIGAEAFRDLPSLKKVTFGKNVKKTGKKAFFKCKKA